MTVTVEKIKNILYSIKDINNLKFFDENSKLFIDFKNNILEIKLELNYPVNEYFNFLIQENISSELRKINILHFTINITFCITRQISNNGLRSYPNIKNIIAVVSGKGGVGKSTISANIAYSLHLLGARVGIVDADIYGPSIPVLLGHDSESCVADDGVMLPVNKHNLQANSLGFLIDYNSPAILRGPMISKIFEQLIIKTNWKDLDYLIVDMPPGTGDIAITLAKNIPVVGALVVTTPQDMSLMDVRRCIKMYRKIGTRIIGVVENMSSYVCPHCKEVEYIFGVNGGKRLSKQYDVPLLEEIPFNNRIRKQSDIGEFSIFDDKSSEIYTRYLELAFNLVRNIAFLPMEKKNIFPPIVVK